MVLWVYSAHAQLWHEPKTYVDLYSPIFCRLFCTFSGFWWPLFIISQKDEILFYVVQSFCVGQSCRIAIECSGERKVKYKKQAEITPLLFKKPFFLVLLCRHGCSLRSFSPHSISTMAMSLHDGLSLGQS